MDAFASDVERFYQRQMTGLGWDLFASGDGETGAVIMFFMKAEELLSVTILINPDGSTYVLLVK